MILPDEVVVAFVAAVGTFTAWLIRSLMLNLEKNTEALNGLRLVLERYFND